MRVEFKKVIEIEGLGLFKCESEWEEFSKWVCIDNSLKTFVSVDVDKNNILVGLFGNSSDDKNKDISIVIASSIVSEFLKREKNETK